MRETTNCILARNARDAVSEKLRNLEGECCTSEKLAKTFGWGRIKCVTEGGTCISCIDKALHKLADEIEAEQSGSKSTLLPEGIEWPRFEDGELVKPFDKLPSFDSEGVQKFIWTSSNRGAWQLQDAEGNILNVMHGRRVKRPEVLGADGKPILIGETVFDADGVPIKAGDTVYVAGRGCCTVLDPASREFVGCLTVKGIGVDDDSRVFFCDPSIVTHRKPDSQEAIDDDATMPSGVYCIKNGLLGKGEDVDEATVIERHILHLLERQRKLLGGE